MLANGCDCSIVVKTAHQETDIPYSAETLREAVSFLQEEAAIEGDGVCRGIQKSGGVIGCVVTPLTIGTAPILFYLAMGWLEVRHLFLKQEAYINIILTFCQRKIRDTLI